MSSANLTREDAPSIENRTKDMNRQYTKDKMCMTRQHREGHLPSKGLAFFKYC